jgi:hypothetical protein
MEETAKKDIGKLLDDREGMDRALARAVREAVLQHKREGNPVAIRRDGKVVWINPDEIELPDENS